jgi:hypothetical protein
MDRRYSIFILAPGFWILNPVALCQRTRRWPRFTTWNVASVVNVIRNGILSRGKRKLEGSDYRYFLFTIYDMRLMQLI